MLQTFLQKHGWILITLFVIIILIIPFLLAQVGVKQQQSSSSPNSTTSFSPFSLFGQPTPTPFVLPKLLVVETNPQNKETDISQNPEILVTFSRSLNSSEIQSFQLRTSPEASGSASWNNNFSQFSFTPYQLLPNTTYTFSTITNSFSYAWSFTTQAPQPINSQEVQAGLEDQTKSDTLWGQKTQQLYQEYPWYNNLPISSDDYFVSFDSTSHILTADLFLSDTSNVSQINMVKDEVLSQLSSLGIDTTKIVPQFVIHAKEATPAP